MKISFRCPQCRSTLSFDPADAGREESPCPQCGKTIPLHINAAMRERGEVTHCAICNCPAVYLQKDFNRTFGLLLFLAAAAACLYLVIKHHQVFLGYGILVGAAALDFLLYKLLPEVIICYRCHAQYRDFAPSPGAAPFELGLAEKYDPIDQKLAAENPAAEWKQR